MPSRSLTTVVLALILSSCVAARADVSHDPLDRLLKAHVSDTGLVDYDALEGDRADLDAYVASLEDADLAALSDDARLALLINAYNAMMLQLVLDERPIAKVVDIDDPFKKQRWTLGGRRVSLDDVEHDMIRGNFDEPRIHWAVNCAAISCPPLRAEAYTGDRLEEQLAQQEQFVHSDPRFVRYDGGDTLVLTGLYRFYAEDFADDAGDIIPYVAARVPPLAERVAAGGSVTARFLPYDWTVNDVSNADALRASATAEPRPATED